MDYLTKPEPATLRLAFTVESPNENGVNFIDLSQCTSLTNRKFMPQGLNWAVAGLTFLTTSSTTGVIQVEKLPNTWVMANSWVKAEAAWERMNEAALSEAESVRPRFLDFKVYADAAHHANGSDNNLLPGTLAGSFAIPGEWSYSKMIIPDTTLTSGVREREFVATGANYPGPGFSGNDAVSLIEGYAASRSLPPTNDPNTPTDALVVDGQFPANWLSATFNEGNQQTDVVISDMVTENNQAPYPFEDDGIHVDTMYPNGANQLSGLDFHDLAVISTTTIGARTRVHGGNFPCGLIKITTGNLTGSWTMFVDLVPGPMRGYLAEPMTEMN